MIGNFVILFHHTKDNIFTARYSTCDQEKGCVRVVLAEHVQDFGRRDGVWPIVNRQRYDRLLGLDKVDYVGRSLCDCRDDSIRLEHNYSTQNEY